MLIVTCNKLTPRLQYICDIMLGSALGIDFRLVEISGETIPAHPVISYLETKHHPDHFHIKPHGLLQEENIIKQQIDCFQWQNTIAFFRNADDMGFDIFSAAFFLISRYEEYLPHQLDNYGRYDHRQSLAFREGFLNLPLVNIWITHFAAMLNQRFPGLLIQRPAFRKVLTYDIDIAWSYKHKGWLRNLGGLARGDVSKRWKVLSGKEKDPFDSYDLIDKLHEGMDAEIIYFFLMAKQRGKYDKNISPEATVMQTLIQRHASKYDTGIHPSWKSGDHPELVNEEINALQKITSQKITASRQHYIRFRLPETYRKLQCAGIEKDYSMGYGSINGFRASYADSFLWYDLEKEETSSLRIYPFCYMEANSFYEQQQDAASSLKEIMHYYETCRAHHGMFVSIFHNHFLGEDPLYHGWREMYETFISQIR